MRQNIFECVWHHILRAVNGSKILTETPYRSVIQKGINSSWISELAVVAKNPLLTREDLLNLAGKTSLYGNVFTTLLEHPVADDNLRADLLAVSKNISPSAYRSVFRVSDSDLIFSTLSKYSEAYLWVEAATENPRFNYEMAEKLLSFLTGRETGTYYINSSFVEALVCTDKLTDEELNVVLSVVPESALSSYRYAHVDDKAETVEVMAKRLKAERFPNVFVNLYQVNPDAVFNALLKAGVLPQVLNNLRYQILGNDQDMSTLGGQYLALYNLLETRFNDSDWQTYIRDSPLGKMLDTVYKKLEAEDAELIESLPLSYVFAMVYMDEDIARKAAEFYEDWRKWDIEFQAEFKMTALL